MAHPHAALGTSSSAAARGGAANAPPCAAVAALLSSPDTLHAELPTPPGADPVAAFVALALADGAPAALHGTYGRLGASEMVAGRWQPAAPTAAPITARSGPRSRAVTMRRALQGTVQRVTQTVTWWQLGGDAGGTSSASALVAIRSTTPDWAKARPVTSLEYIIASPRADAAAVVLACAFDVEIARTGLGLLIPLDYARRTSVTSMRADRQAWLEDATRAAAAAATAAAGTAAAAAPTGTGIPAAADAEPAPPPAAGRHVPAPLRATPTMVPTASPLVPSLVASPPSPPTPPRSAVPAPRGRDDAPAAAQVRLPRSAPRAAAAAAAVPAPAPRKPVVQSTPSLPMPAPMVDVPGPAARPAPVSRSTSGGFGDDDDDDDSAGALAREWHTLKVPTVPSVYARPWDVALRDAIRRQRSHGSAAAAAAAATSPPTPPPPATTSTKTRVPLNAALHEAYFETRAATVRTGLPDSRVVDAAAPTDGMAATPVVTGPSLAIGPFVTDPVTGTEMLADSDAAALAARASASASAPEPSLLASGLNLWSLLAPPPRQPPLPPTWAAHTDFHDPAAGSSDEAGAGAGHEPTVGATIAAAIPTAAAALLLGPSYHDSSESDGDYDVRPAARRRASADDAACVVM